MTCLVRAVDLVRKDVQEHLGVGLSAQVSLVRQLALLLERAAQLVRVGQVAVVNLRPEDSRQRTSRLAVRRCRHRHAPGRCPKAS
jgi:hypothetical protein